MLWPVVPAAPAVTLTGTRKQFKGSLYIAFTNNPGAPFTVVAASNQPLALAAWNPLSGVAENSPCQFQFTDSQATNGPVRFYCVRSS